MAKVKYRKREFDHPWGVGSRALVEFEGADYQGEVKAINSPKPGYCQIFFEDDGETYAVWHQQMRPAPLEMSDDYFDGADVDETDDNLREKGDGFHQYRFQWDGIKTNFRADIRPSETDEKTLKVHGCIRKTRIYRGSEEVDAWAVDIWGKYAGRTYNLESILYTDGDPRRDLVSAEKDMCAAVNRFFFNSLQGDAETLEQLRKKADHPLVVISKLSTLDTLIQDLTECRRKAMSTGSFRHLGIVPDDGQGPTMTIKINLAKQAFAMEGKVPPIGAGHRLDGITTVEDRKVARELTRTSASVGGDKPARGVSSGTLAGASLEELQPLYNEAKAAGNKTVLRQIRARLRALGISGGMKGVKQ